MIKKFTSLLLVFILSISFCGCKGKELEIYAADGSLLATISEYGERTYKTYDNNLAAYIDIVYDEAVEILKSTQNTDTATAKENLINSQYSIHTNFDPAVFEAIKSAYETKAIENLDFGCAVTNNSGKLIAVYSAGNEKVNFATNPTAPYSSLKPLSVYTPAIEGRLATWSTLYVDSPVKKVTLSYGSKVDWPTNASGEYLNKKVTIEQALKESLNTVSVKCLMDYGVTNSINFLKEKFNFPLSAEEQIVLEYGEEEVLGNLGMGFLREGVSPVDMAGYYQIFANGGKYAEPQTIKEIQKSSGNSIYSFKYNAEQVIRESSSVVLNNLLQTVVTSKGTGKNAACEGIEIGGKTGTGDDGKWFVGFTPEYSCAVWHGPELDTNTCPEIFSQIIKNIPNKQLSKFALTPDVKRALYCCESGLLRGEKCDDFKMGFFTTDTLEKTCDSH